MSELTEMKCIACQAGAPLATAAETEKWKPKIPDWEFKEVEGIQRLERMFDFNNFKETLAFVNKVGAIAEDEGHHPVMLVEFRNVTVSWWTHKIKGLHANDFIMAAKTDQL
ncbi:MAG: 4a-hydroxytetrahydrobiopterin dehydratase [SAR324 cluster bacterium]|nr:4a-hydroxytetrahydrobiopterin dehydratase [SAR324 cluster bacterium]